MKIPFVPPKTNIEKIFTVLSGIIPTVFVPWLFIQLINLQNSIFIKPIIINVKYIFTILLKLSVSAWAAILILLIFIKVSPRITKSIFNIDNIYDDEAKYNFFKFANLAVNTAITGVVSSIIISAIFGIHIEGGILVLEPDKNILATFLSIIAGSLTFLTFTENRRRNDIESSKNDWDKQHTIRMNRRDRYISLVEKLDSKSSSVRLGAVHALVFLADEWVDEWSKEKNKEEVKVLVDDTEELKSYDIAHKEAQNIIRVLCAYLRQPFELANRKYINKEYLNDTDQKELSTEIVIRKTLVNTYFKRRLTSISETGKGSWSNFYFHLSNITFFYGIDLSECLWERNVSFKGSVFYEKAVFSNAICNGEKGMNFRMCTHHKMSALDVDNSSNADFSKSVYGGKVIFNKHMNSPKNIKDILIFTKWNNELPDCCFDEENNMHSFIHQMDNESLNEFKSHPKKFRDKFLKNIE
ncbi:hypothetical protein [Rothia dentocariosa]|jgi:hypothetical protein|uniref:hypothetical protein n=1 Tax=Rothia dentocariosa TaxID=2047 RepID=UPI00248F5338|nr:hypothetical protein [Rothia dentocariosa]